MPSTRSSASWALGAAAVAIVAILTGGLAYVVRSARSLPTEVIESSRAALRELRDVASAFRTGTVTTSFRSDAARLLGTSRLQVVELRQLETFERRDAESVLWGALALPDVVVEARAPVVYSYFVDLEKDWRFRLDGRDMLVDAPALEWTPPATDVSALRYEVRAGSVFRDERLVSERLRAELTGLLAMRARQHVPLVREGARRQAEAFVERFMGERFSDAGAYRVRVRFADEGPWPTPRPPVVPSPLG